jgi:hypothetical protein
MPRKRKSVAKDETDLDFVQVINTVLPFEKHLPGMNYCGPGTRLRHRLYPDNTPKPGNEPVDRVDEASLKHDIAYSQHDDLKHRMDADKELINDLKNIKDPTFRERIERFIVLPILYIKRFIGMCIVRTFRL